MIIGFAYKMQVGKTSAAKYLAGGFGFVRDNFAFSLKEGIGKSVFGLTDQQLTDPVLKETVDPYWNMTPRKILQLAGTEAMRNTFDKDIWVKTLENRIQSAPASSFAIDDVRYFNEANAIKRWGGKVILINRDTGLSSTHISETEMDSYTDYDGVIDNHSTFTDLYYQLNKLVNL